MRIANLITAVAAGVMFSACATEYQSASFTGGFTDTQLAPDVFRVSFSGNAFTSSDRAQDFAMLRAAELTLANDARFFGLLSSADQSRTETYVSPGSAMYGSGTTTYTAPQVSTYYKPGVGMMIRTFKTRPKGGFAFDAEFVANSVRTKYGIK